MCLRHLLPALRYMFEALAVSFEVHMHPRTLPIPNQGLVKQAFFFLDHSIFITATKNYSTPPTIVLPQA